MSAGGRVAAGSGTGALTRSPGARATATRHSPRSGAGRRCSGAG
jgi:hypothetical protein